MDNQLNPQEPISKQTPVITDSVVPEISTPEIPISEPELPPLPPQPETEEVETSKKYQEVLDQYATAQTETPTTPIPETEPKSTEAVLSDLGITAKPPQNNIFKILLIIALIIFVLVFTAFVFVYFKSQQTNTSTPTTSTSKVTPTSVSSGNCSLNGKNYLIGDSFVAADGCNTCTCESQDIISCTEKECLTTTPATKSATTAPTKTVFQKMITNWSLYKDITSTERTDLSGTSDWMGNVKSTDALYPFVQKIIKGSFKKLTINKENLKSITGDYSYTFYFTPNYEKWSNEKFQSNFIPEYAHSGIGELSPLYAYSDKLVWDSYSCGGVITTYTEECVSLTKEIETAFP